MILRGELMSQQLLILINIEKLYELKCFKLLQTSSCVYFTIYCITPLCCGALSLLLLCCCCSLYLLCVCPLLSRCYLAVYTLLRDVPVHRERERVQASYVVRIITHREQQRVVPLYRYYLITYLKLICNYYRVQRVALACGDSAIMGDYVTEGMRSRAATSGPKLIEKKGEGRTLSAAGYRETYPSCIMYTQYIVY